MSDTADARRRRIGHIDDHVTTRVGLRTLLDGCEDLVLVAGAATVPELLEQTTDLDLVLLDLRLADGSTPRSNVAALQEQGMEVLAYTSGEDPYMLRQAARAGVLGVLPKTEDEATVVSAIREAAFGHIVPSAEWAAAIDGDPGLPDVGLTPRQREVLELYASGLTAVSVARRTGLAEQTVLDYINRIRRKYAEAGRPATSKTDLFQRALEDGFAPLPETPRLKWRSRMRNALAPSSRGKDSLSDK